MDPNPPKVDTTKPKKKTFKEKLMEKKKLKLSKAFKPKGFIPKNMPVNTASEIKLPTPGTQNPNQSSIALGRGQPFQPGPISDHKIPIPKETQKKKGNMLKNRIAMKKKLQKSRKNSEAVGDSDPLLGASASNVKDEKKSQWDDGKASALNLKQTDEVNMEKKKKKPYNMGKNNRFQESGYQRPKKPFHKQNPMKVNNFNGYQGNPGMNQFPPNQMAQMNMMHNNFMGNMMYSQNMQNMGMYNGMMNGMGYNMNFRFMGNNQNPKFQNPMLNVGKKNYTKKPLNNKSKKMEVSQKFVPKKVVEKKEEKVEVEKKKEVEEPKKKEVEEPKKEPEQPEKKKEIVEEKPKEEKKETKKEEKVQEPKEEPKVEKKEEVKVEEKPKEEKQETKKEEPKPKEEKKVIPEEKKEDSPKKEEEKKVVQEKKPIEKKEDPVPEKIEKVEPTPKAEEPKKEKPEKPKEEEKVEEPKRAASPEDPMKKASKNYKKIVYLESELLSLIDGFDEPIQQEFRALNRDFKEQVSKAPSKGSRYRDRDDNRRGRRNRYDDRRRNDRKYGGSRREHRETNENNSEVVLERDKFDESTMKKLREIKENLGGWMYEKKNESEEAKTKKKIKFLLNQLTMDTLKKIQPELVEYCHDRELAIFMSDELVKKAWKEIKYRNCYSKLVRKLTSEWYEWEAAEEEPPAPAKNGKKDKKKKKKKKKKATFLKKRIINKLEKQYSQGFKQYQEFTVKTMADENMSKEDKTDKILKKKDGLFGNVLFMAQLFVKGVLSLKSFKLIVAHGLISVCKTYIDFSNQPEDKTSKAILLDYVEAMIKLWEDAGATFEVKRQDELAKDRKKGKATTSLEHDKRVESELVSFMQARDFGWPENVKSDNEMKKVFFGIDNVLKVFLRILHFIRDQELDIRLNSLIENFDDLRSRGWERIFKGQAAAESKKNIEKKIRQEKRAEEEMMRKDRRKRKHDRKNYNYDDGYYGEKDYYDDYDDYPKDFKKKKGKYKEYTKKPKGKVGKTCLEATQKLLQQIYKTKKFDEAAYKKIWDLSEEACDDIEDLLQNYLVVFMEKGRAEEAEFRRQVIYDWSEQEKLTPAQFMTGFNKGCKLSFQDYSDKFKYLDQLSEVLGWMILNKGADLSLMVVDKVVKGKELDDEDDLEDLQFFYDDLLKAMKKKFETFEDEEMKKETLAKWAQLNDKFQKLF